LPAERLFVIPDASPQPATCVPLPPEISRVTVVMMGLHPSVSSPLAEFAAIWVETIVLNAAPSSVPRIIVAPVAFAPKYVELKVAVVDETTVRPPVYMRPDAPSAVMFTVSPVPVDGDIAVVATPFATE
jgi:hypothetical protein